MNKLTMVSEMVTVKRGKGCEDLEKASKLQVMQYFGIPLEQVDQLWLEHWQALMNEVGSIEYKPSTMFVDKCAKPPVSKDGPEKEG